MFRKQLKVKTTVEIPFFSSQTEFLDPIIKENTGKNFACAFFNSIIQILFFETNTIDRFVSNRKGIYILKIIP
ncbi:MAG TPA: hypothetical protein DCX89_03640 [Saprospirales bacterium]|nr:hypothetical protein [Saprospirales bacterium]HAY70958.1 hypothetical protein [Saprospirales bacterium]